MVSWGLYNKAKNTITLNIKLIQADLESIKMVVFHGLCHMLEQNHSKRFYTHLAREFPHYKQIRKRLKRYSVRF
ncbi:MAG: M48 family metallopeptidase [Clostridiales bacterium]|nr:M48 family metallopeptidase [Clostridiales bacterium]